MFATTTSGTYSPWAGAGPRQALPTLLALALFALPLSASPSHRATGDPEPKSQACETDPRHAQLDFLRGTWRLVDASGEDIATARVERRHGGCLLQEEWVAPSGWSGQSVSFFNPASGTWQRLWVDGHGAVLRGEGEAGDERIRFVGERIQPDGSRRRARLLLRRLSGGGVRHLLELGSPEGTWTTHLEATYIPLGGPDARQPAASPRAAPQSAEPTKPQPSTRASASPAEEPEPPQQPRQEPAVVATSQRASPEEIRREEAPQVQMASPMTLGIPLGPLHLIPEGSGWSTQDTAAYVCRGVTVKKVTVGKGRVKKGQRTVELSFWLHTSRMSHRIDLRASLYSSEEVVETVAIEDISLGLWVPAHGKEGLRQSVTLSLDEARFQEIFRRENQPVLRVTLTVP